MDKSKYEREYTAFLENSRKRIRTATNDYVQIKYSLGKVISSRNLDMEEARLLQAVINRLPPKKDEDNRECVSFLDKVIKSLNQKYDEAKPNGYASVSMEQVIIILEKVKSILKKKNVRTSSIDSRLEDIKEAIG